MKKRYSNKYHQLPYNPDLKKRAAQLRKAGNLSEVLLWMQLKSGLFKNLDFDRQKIIGNYIVDFYCAEKNVIIEIDGETHNYKTEYDETRDVFLKELGLTVVHILDSDVKRDLQAVVLYLEKHEAFK